MPIDQKQLSLENFVFWLTNLSYEDKFFYRQNIYETVKICGVQNVLDELEKHAQSFKGINEAIQTTQLVKAIERNLRHK